MEDNFLLPNECIICLESNDTNNVIININDIHKKCNCKSPVHNECLIKWYSYNKLCPICRNSIYASDDEEDQQVPHNIEYCNCLKFCNTCCCWIIITICCIFIYNSPFMTKHLKP